jgi:hypothetical protein
MLVGGEGEQSATGVVEFFAQVNVKWLESLAIPAGTLKGLVRVA